MNVVGLAKRRKDQGHDEQTSEARARKQHSIQHCRLLSIHLLEQVWKESEVATDAEKHDADHGCEGDAALLSERDGECAGNLQHAQEPIHLLKV
jgi:hypothetical protein